MKYLSLAFILLVLCFSATAQEKPADTSAKLISAPAFSISAEDEAADIDGIIKVAVDINRSGEVTRAVVYVGPSWPCSGNFDDRVNAVMRNAEKTVSSYRFSPAIKNGMPVESRVGISLTIGKTAREKTEKKTPNPSAPEPNLIKGGVVNGRALSLVKPIYPRAAREARASGSVSVQVLIDENGKVISAQAIDGSPLLQFAARAAACESKFSPTLLAGTPVKVSGIITYNFIP